MRWKHGKLPSSVVYDDWKASMRCIEMTVSVRHKPLHFSTDILPSDEAQASINSNSWGAHDTEFTIAEEFQSSYYDQKSPRIAVNSILRQTAFCHISLLLE